MKKFKLLTPHSSSKVFFTLHSSFKELLYHLVKLPGVIEGEVNQPEGFVVRRRGLYILHRQRTAPYPDRHHPPFAVVDKSVQRTKM